MKIGGKMRLIAIGGGAVLVIGAAAAGYAAWSAPRLMDTSIDLGSVPAAAARLDPEHETMTLPLDEYLMSTQQLSDGMLARELLVNDCLTAASFESAPVVVTDPQRLGFERPWGIWDVDGAREFGWLAAAEPDRSAEDAAIARLSAIPGWDDAAQRCAEEVDASSSVVLLGEGIASIDDPETAFAGVVFDGISGSYEAVHRSAQFEEVRAEFDTCAQRAGYSTQDDFGVTAGEADEEAPVAAASCNLEAKVYETLGAVQATYQRGYIEKHAAALAEAATARDELVARVDRILAEHEAISQ